MRNKTYRELFKYRAIDEHFHEMVRDGELFFPNRHQLNDPDEALIRFDRQKTISEYELNRNPFAPFAIKPIEPRYLGIDDYYFFCLARKKDDVLMWSHYGDSHRGICMEFDFSCCKRRFLKRGQEELPLFIEYDESISISDVQYISKAPTYLLEPNGIDPAFSFEESEFFGYSKLSCWKDEMEVRLRIRSGPQKRRFPKTILTAIHFGIRVDELTRTETIREFREAGYRCHFTRAVGIKEVEDGQVIAFEMMAEV